MVTPELKKDPSLLVNVARPCSDDLDDKGRLAASVIADKVRDAARQLIKDCGAGEADLQKWHWQLVHEISCAIGHARLDALKTGILQRPPEQD